MDASSVVMNNEWFCVMNTWDEALASCASPQEIPSELARERLATLVSEHELILLIEIPNIPKLCCCGMIYFLLFIICVRQAQAQQQAAISEADQEDIRLKKVRR